MWAQDGTTVNAVAPGPVQSEMLDSIPPQIVKSQKESTPVERRVGTPVEVANVVCWLASDEASWVSGQVLNCSGGWSMY
jgi:3-oxoacyl-[acyl-carrier protein] reductase